MPRTISLLLCFLLCSIGGTLHAQQAFTNAQNQFALKLYRQVGNDSGNVFISPMSINIALALAMEGSAGETREELSTVPGLKPIENVSQAYRSLIPRHQSEARRQERENPQFRKSAVVTLGSETPTQLIISNALWHNTKFSMMPEYLGKAKDNYDAEVFGYSDADIGTIQSNINAWASEKTNSRIPFSSFY